MIDNPPTARLAEDGELYRARVLSCAAEGAEEGATVLYVDYGNSEMVQLYNYICLVVLCFKMYFDRYLDVGDTNDIYQIYSNLTIHCSCF